jgi:hypothetical protein
MKRPFILLMVFMFLAGCTNEHSVKVYLIPKGYQGPILMIEDPNSKNELQQKGDTIIFDFRKNIVLRFKDKFVESSNYMLNLKYYYIDSIGNKTSIPIALNTISKKDNKAYIYFKFTQVGESSQCDLISTSNALLLNLHRQEKLCDSLLAKHP